MRSRALTPAEIETIRRDLASSTDRYAQRDRTLFEIGINCGLRISEALALTVGQVWQHERIVDRLELTRTKGDKPRAVPLNKPAKDAISALLGVKRERGERMDDDAPLFVSRHGQRLVRRQAQNRLGRVYWSAGLAGKVTTHSLRKAFATRLHDRGVKIREIQVLLGHSSVSTTQRYIDVRDDQLVDAVAMLE